MFSPASPPGYTLPLPLPAGQPPPAKINYLPH